MQSKGVNAFIHYVGPYWRTYEKTRNLEEMGRTVNAMVSTEYEPVGVYGRFPREPYAPKYHDTLKVWDKDGWMLQQINSISKYLSPIKKLYDTLHKRNAKQFYNDFCPFRFGRHVTFCDMDEAFKLIPSTTLCDFAMSLNPTVLWVRYEILNDCPIGKTAINYYRLMGKNAKKFDLPTFKR